MRCGCGRHRGYRRVAEPPCTDIVSCQQQLCPDLAERSRKPCQPTEVGCTALCLPALICPRWNGR